MNGMSRVEARAAFDVPTRLRLAENDLDSQERVLRDAVDNMRATANRLVWSVVGLLTAVVAGLVGVILSAPR